MTQYAISATAGMFLLIMAGLLWFVGNQMLPRLTAVLVAIGVAGIVTTGAGDTANSTLVTINRVIDKFTVDTVDTRVSGFIAFIAGFIVIAHIKRRSVSTLTLAAAALFPLALRASTGDLGDGLRSLFAGLVNVVGPVANQIIA